MSKSILSDKLALWEATRHKSRGAHREVGHSVGQSAEQSGGWRARMAAKKAAAGNETGIGLSSEAIDDVLRKQQISESLRLALKNVREKIRKGSPQRTMPDSPKGKVASAKAAAASAGC